MQDAVRVENEPADVRLLQKSFDAGDVGAFRQPDAARVAAKATPVMVARGQDLRADGRRMVRQQRQQSVRRGGGDDFNPAFVLKFSERGDEVAPVRIPCVADGREAVVIHPGEFAVGAVPVSAVDFLFGEVNQPVQVPLVTALEQRIQQHRTERRRKRERERRGHAVAPPAFEGLQERDVSFRDGLEEPVFLQEFFVFRVAHERQVRVQNE